MKNKPESSPPPHAWLFCMLFFVFPPAWLLCFMDKANDVRHRSPDASVSLRLTDCRESLNNDRWGLCVLNILPSYPSWHDGWGDCIKMFSSRQWEGCLNALESKHTDLFLCWMQWKNEGRWYRVRRVVGDTRSKLKKIARFLSGGDWVRSRMIAKNSGYVGPAGPIV